MKPDKISQIFYLDIASLIKKQMDKQTMQRTSQKQKLITIFLADI